MRRGVRIPATVVLMARGVRVDPAHHSERVVGTPRRGIRASETGWPSAPTRLARRVARWSPVWHTQNGCVRDALRTGSEAGGVWYFRRQP